MIKHFISLIFFTLTLLGDGTFYINKSKETEIENVKNNKIEKIEIVVGKSYYVNTNNISLSTSTNGESSVVFSNDILFKLNQNTKIQIDTFDHPIKNIENQPETIIYAESELQSSLLEGELEVVVKNPNLILGTMMTTIVPKSGKYFIKVDEKSVTVASIEGEIKLLDTFSKKEVTLKTGDIVVVVEAPKLTGRNGEVFRKQHLFNVRKMEEDESKFFSSALNDTQKQNENIKFAVIDKKVVGIKIN